MILQEALDEFSRGGLRNFRLAVEELDAQATRRMFSENPELHAKLREVSAVDALHRTLRGGHPDELGWAELEAVCLELGGAPVAFVHHPHMVLTNGLVAVACDTRGPVCRHELALPPETRLAGLRYADGQIQVVYADDDDNLLGYWSDDPQRVRPFTAEDCWMVKPGDTRLPRSGRLISDGERWWSPEGQLIDPVTGLAGKTSRPPFLAGDIELEESWLVPTSGSPETPLGTRDGLSGWRCRHLPDGGLEGETIDGRRVRLEAGVPYLDNEPLGLLRLPGAEVLLSAFNGGFCFYDLEGWPLFFFGMDAPFPERGLPHLFWNSMTVRDAAASAWMRQLTREECQAMYDAEDPVPEVVTHPGLQEGILDSVRFARRWQERLTQLLEQRVGEEVALSEELLQKGLYPFAPWEGASPPGATLDLEGPLAWLRGGEAPEDLETSVLWWPALPFLKALAWRAAAPFTPGTEREVLLAFLETWLAHEPKPPLKWRCFAARFEPGKLPWKPTEGVAFEEYEGNRYLLRYDEYGYAMEVAHSGEFIEPPGVEIQADLRLEPWDGLKRVIELVRSRGPIPTHPEVVDALVEASELPDPVLRLLWAGAPHFYEAIPPKLLRRLQLRSEAAIPARDYLAQPYVLGRLLSAFWGDDPAQAWTDPLAAAPALARTWEDLNQ